MIIRILDIIFSIIAITILLPIFIPIMIILKFTGEGEIFYIQNRIGKNEKKFGLIKFATMLKNSPNMKLGTITIKNDPRILKTGSFLRNTKINELPQIFNILIGDMSFIGPRPLTPESYNFYSDKTKLLISSIRPGLSGLGSIIFRNEEKILSLVKNPKHFHKNVIAPYKGKLEEYYVKNKSIYLYLILIFFTVIIVLFPNNHFKKSLFKNIPQPNNKLEKYLLNKF